MCEFHGRCSTFGVFSVSCLEKSALIAVPLGFVTQCHHLSCLAEGEPPGLRGCTGCTGSGRFMVAVVPS